MNQQEHEEKAKHELNKLIRFIAFGFLLIIINSTAEPYIDTYLNPFKNGNTSGLLLPIEIFIFVAYLLTSQQLKQHNHQEHPTPTTQTEH